MVFNDTRRRLAAALLCTAALAGCASGWQSSQIVGERYFRTPIDTWRVSISSIDGSSAIQRPAFVGPGRHTVVVQGPTAPASPQGELRRIELDVAPCTRYYLVAVRPNPLSPDFDVKVDFAEPLGGCTPPGAAR